MENKYTITVHWDHGTGPTPVEFTYAAFPLLSQAYKVFDEMRTAPPIGVVSVLLSECFQGEEYQLGWWTPDCPVGARFGAGWSIGP